MEMSQRTEKGGLFCSMIKDILWTWDILKAEKVFLYKTYYFLIAEYGSGT
jgi:hypothetical protein